MRDQLSDEKLDQILKTLVVNASLDDETLDEIASAPQLWWGVQRSVVGRRPVRGWIPSFDWRIVLVSSVFVFAILGLWSLGRSAKDLTVAADTTVLSLEIATRLPASVVETTDDVPAPATIARVIKRDRAASKPARNSVRQTTEQPANEGSVEYKSEFIALMYSQEPESGQIVKVKVPRSMMVSLGVSTNVQNNSELVNAEVLMGDDGSARAIRFIQNR